MANFFDDPNDCGATCARCGQSHEWVRPGKTQPTCECDVTCWLHDEPVRFEYRSEDHPANVAAKKIGYGMGLGYHCPRCEAAHDAQLCGMAERN